MMKIRTTTFGISLIFLLASCNAFRQKVTQGPGTEEFQDHTLEILIMLGVAFALGLWLGYILWNRFKQMVDGLRMENDSLQASLSTLRGESEALKLRFSALESEKTGYQSQVSSLEYENSALKNRFGELEAEFVSLREKSKDLETDLGLALASSPESAMIPMEIEASPVDVHVEDLVEEAKDETPEVVATMAAEPEPVVEIVENQAVEIDPVPEEAKIEEPVLETEAIALTTIEAEEETVAETVVQVPDVQEVVVAPMVAEALVAPAEVHDEATVAEIENPVADEKEIEAPQIEEPAQVVEPQSVVEETEIMAEEEIAPEIVATIVAAAPDKFDDLKIVEGIGPKIEELLQRNGIVSFSQLAATPVNRIKEILVSAGPNYALHDPGTWPAQALLAANGEWDNLKAYQGFLNAGKRPK